MGQCVGQCSTGYYAKNTTMKCVSSYTCKPSFGVNVTHSCQATCPAGSYKNMALYRCDACPSTCLTCTTWSTCQTCNTTLSVFAQNYCWPYCSVEADPLLQLYFDRDNATCV